MKQTVAQVMDLVLIVVITNVTQTKTTVVVSMTVVIIQKCVHEFQMLLSKVVVQGSQVSMECVCLVYREFREFLKIHGVSVS